MPLVAVEFLLSIEGAGQTCWSAPFCGEDFLHLHAPGLPLSRGAGAERLRGDPVAAGQRLPLTRELSAKLTEGEKTLDVCIASRKRKPSGLLSLRLGCRRATSLVRGRLWCSAPHGFAEPPSPHRGRLWAAAGLFDGVRHTVDGDGGEVGQVDELGEQPGLLYLIALPAAGVGAAP